MLIMRWILVCALFFYGTAHSQEKPIPPITLQAKAGDKKDNPSGSKNEVTITLPSTMNVSLGGKLDVVSENKQKSTNEETSKWLDPNTWLTLALVVANILLWLTTKSLVREAKTTSDIAKTAADAAKISADSYQLSERAWMSCVKIEPTNVTDAIDEKTEKWGNGIMFVFHWTNAGHTVAINCNLQTNSMKTTSSAQIPIFPNVGTDIH